MLQLTAVESIFCECNYRPMHKNLMLTINFYLKPVSAKVFSNNVPYQPFPFSSSQENQKFTEAPFN